MIDRLSMIDLIDQAQHDVPFCSCGRHTTAVWRDGAVWLECASLGESREGLIRRIVASLAAPMHARMRVVESPARSSTATLTARC
jgi:hypothetical protein